MSAPSARPRLIRRFVGFLVAASGSVGGLSCKDATGPITPEVPTAVSVVRLSSNSVKVTWSPNADASSIRSYNVFRNGGKVGEVNGLLFVDSALSDLVLYKYGVSANGTNGLVSELSAETAAATITLPDATPPVVLSTSPSAGATGVDRSTKISVTFSEPLDPATAVASNFSVRAGIVAVAGTVAYAPATRTIEFTPAITLPNTATISVSVSSQIHDAAGNPLASSLAFAFATRDDIPPAVVSTTIPPTGDVPVTQVLAVTMSEPIDASSVTSSNVRLTLGGSGAIVPGLISYDAATQAVTFTPSSGLASATDYILTVGAGIKDVAGNASTVAFTKSFRTADVTPPTVVSSNPVDAAFSVSVNTPVSVVFSKEMDASTITTSSMTLRLTSSGAFAAGSIAYDAATRTAVYQPSSPLLSGSGYTITVSTSVRGSNGVALAQPFLSTFTTVAVVPPADVTPPSVVSTIPSSGAQNIAIGTPIRVTFSEAMDPSTVNVSTILIAGPGGAIVNGTVTYDNATFTTTFVPFASLANGTVYTLSATTGLKDVAGNALAAQFSTTFTTVSSLPPDDTTPPAIVSAMPANGSTNVPVTSPVTVTFSEDVVGVSSSTFSLSVAGVTVAGSVSYDGATRTASFAPAAGLLAEGQVYTATVTSAVKDLAGNSVASNFVFSFTTVDLTPPTVVSRSPSPGSSAVATNTVIQVGFSEAMNPSTINSTTLQVSLNGALVSGIVSYNAGSRIATFTPSSALANNRTFTVTTGTGARDVAGNALANADSFTFTTVAAPPAFDISGFSVPSEGWWQTTTEASGVSIHIHIVFQQSGSGLALSPICPLGINDRCITLARNQAGANAIGPESPGYVWVLLSNLNGTLSGSEISFTFRNANGVSFAFAGVVNSPYLMTGTITGATIPTEQVTFTRPPP